jgi:hypothetical protein
VPPSPANHGLETHDTSERLGWRVEGRGNCSGVTPEVCACARRVKSEKRERI